MALVTLVGALYLFTRLVVQPLFVPDLYRPPGLEKIDVPLSPDFSAAVAKLPGKISKDSEKSGETLAAQLGEECGLNPDLQRIGTEVVDSLPDGPQSELGSDQLVELVLQRADGYYHSLWAPCPEEEKLALVQLAGEGLVNPRNRAVIWQLMKKGLIVRDPTFRIMNESFRRFVVSVIPGETIKEWEQEGARMHWGLAKILLLVAVLVFLFLTQQEWLAYVTGFAAAVPALLQVLRLFQRGTPVSGSQ